MKILIITPGHPGPDIKSLPPALTAPYLAGLISNITAEIEIVDLAVQNFLIENYSPSVALFTTTMGQSDQIFNIAEQLKQKGVTIILGGPHATWDTNLIQGLKK